MTLHVSPYTDWPADPGGCRSAVALGIFDGVHMGHRALLTRALQCARADGLVSAAFTFHPHPARVFRARYAPKLIEPMAARLAHFSQLGLDRTVVQPFDTQFAATSPQDFVTEVLVKTLRVQHVIVGSDFVFGYRQSGNVTLLRELGEIHRFTVHVIDPVRVDGMVVSSTKVREFVHDGDLMGASRLLGRPYAVYVRRAATACHVLESAAELLPPLGHYRAQRMGPQKLCEGTLSVEKTLNGPRLRVCDSLAKSIWDAGEPEVSIVLMHPASR